MNNISCEIVISDIRMAEMDGLQLQKKVKTDYPETAFVIVSGYADLSYAREALQFHASDYLLKPVDAEELKRAIKKIKKSKNQDQSSRTKSRSDGTTIEGICIWIYGVASESVYPPYTT